jgi:hypothetical protein
MRCDAVPRSTLYVVDVAWVVMIDAVKGSAVGNV